MKNDEFVGNILNEMFVSHEIPSHIMIPKSMELHIKWSGYRYNFPDLVSLYHKEHVHERMALARYNWLPNWSRLVLYQISPEMGSTLYFQLTLVVYDRLDWLRLWLRLNSRPTMAQTLYSGSDAILWLRVCTGSDFTLCGSDSVRYGSDSMPWLILYMPWLRLYMLWFRLYTIWLRLCIMSQTLYAVVQTLYCSSDSMIWLRLYTIWLRLYTMAQTLCYGSDSVLWIRRYAIWLRLWIRLYTMAHTLCYSSHSMLWLRLYAMAQTIWLRLYFTILAESRKLS